MKHKLAYSELTDTVYVIDGRNVHTDVTKNFIQVVLLWLTEGAGLPAAGERHQRTLRGSNGTDIEISYTVIDKSAKTDNP
jgi:hypothetical protein